MAEVRVSLWSFTFFSRKNEILSKEDGCNGDSFFDKCARLAWVFFPLLDPWETTASVRLRDDHVTVHDWSLRLRGFQTQPDVTQIRKGQV